MNDSQQTKKSITVQEFYDFCSNKLNMKLVAGREGLNKKITSLRIQKTGLALADFVECTSRERVQILGITEISYLNSQSKETNAKTLEHLLSCDLACFVLTTGQKAPENLIEAMDRFKTPLFTCKLESINVIDLVTHFLDLQLAPSTTLHANLLDIFGLGVLITGESGVGKSESALELIARGHRLVADDIVEVKLVENEILLGSCPEDIRYLMEVRGIGLIDVKDLFGVGNVRESKKIEMVINLVRWRDDNDYTRLGLKDKTKKYLGIELPCIDMPVAPGRNLGILLEVAARNQLLKIKGVNVARRVSRRLDRALKRASKKTKHKTIVTEGAGLFE